jgi:hypothetical protein
MDVGVDIDAQFFGSLNQGVEGIPGLNAVGGSGAKADVPFADALSGRQFGGIVVQRQFRETALSLCYNCGKVAMDDESNPPAL